jgi:molybdate transport system substrate-binding protein
LKKLLLLLFGLAAVAGLAVMAACGDDDDATPSPSPTASTSATATEAPLTGSITVFAASSLTASFTQIGRDFEAAHPGSKVTFNFGGSQDLRTQLEQGAEAQVFASADTTQMDLAEQSGVVTGDSSVFAHNRLVIIVPKDNPAGIQVPQDLGKSGVKLILAADTVPVGKYARKFLDAASADASYGAGYKDAVLGNVVSDASNVKEVSSAVQLGEADAGIVYVTDVTSDISDDIATVDIPDAVNQIATYPIALTPAGAEDATAQGFVDYVLSDAGQTTLASFGFIKGVQ